MPPPPSGKPRSLSGTVIGVPACTAEPTCPMRVKIPVGRRRLGQRIGAVHHRRDPARIKQRPDLRAQGLRNPRLGQIALRAQGRSGHGQPSGHQRRKVHFDLRALQKGDLHQAAIRGQRLEISGDVIPAHHVENEVGAAFRLQHIHEIHVAVVDRRLGAKVHAGGTFLVRARRGKDPRAKGMGKLDRRGPDPRGAAMHQEPLARLQRAALKHVGPDGVERLGQARRLTQPHALGHGQAMGRRCGHIFGISPTGQQCADLIAQVDATDALSQRNHFAGSLKPRQITGRGGRCIHPGPLQGIGTVHAGKGHLHHHLPMGRQGHRAGGRLQDLRTTGFGDLHRGHCVTHRNSFHIACVSA